MTIDRRQSAQEVRERAARLAAGRAHPEHQSNGDEQRYACANFAMSFTKGLEHDPATGVIVKAEDFKAFREAIDNGYAEAFTSRVPVSQHKADKRKWEAPTAGTVHDLQGPDAQAVTMAPAPALGSLELAYEIAEVYELAVLRDEPFREFAGNANNAVQASIGRLDSIGYALDGSAGRARTTGPNGLTPQTAFRGSSPGVEFGPYVSQFLLLGNSSVAGDGHPTDGLVRYGPLQIEQRVPKALPGCNFMTDWNDWLAVQNGADPQSGNEAQLFGSPGCVERRFIASPRDLATYVHYDALYQAYLNACLILLGMEAPFDPAFDNLSGNGTWHFNSWDSTGPSITRCVESHRREAGGFALWGGPHILTLVTEVATRALKAVRYQKFNNHCRLRPEALAGRIECAAAIDTAFPVTAGAFGNLRDAIPQTLGAVQALSGNAGSGNSLLPMAFQEGSPMHPAYGAGHATVAGACVTILKAFFDTSTALVCRGNDVMFAHPVAGDTPAAFEPDAKDELQNTRPNRFLTLEGELNKLAANISIGRNMAGVHYYSDYYDSLRMGEEIAIGMLEEQALCYTTDRFVLSVPTYDGGIRRIGAS